MELKQRLTCFEFYFCEIDVTDDKKGEAYCLDTKNPILSILYTLYTVKTTSTVQNCSIHGLMPFDAHPADRIDFWGHFAKEEPHVS